MTTVEPELVEEMLFTDLLGRPRSPVSMAGLGRRDRRRRR
jgi:hypothetical protein